MNDLSATRPSAVQRTRGRGVLLAGRYRLEHQIAVGGMGEVWCATDQVLDRQIAVKLLRGDVGDEPALLDRFRAEARHAGALTHPGVARVYDYGEDGLAGSVAFLVMELVDGQPVSAVARHGPLPPSIVIGLLIQAADALGAAHAMGLVHRDVKPGNLLLSSKGVLKITDFGIAHAIGAAAVTDDGKVAGTARYMSPEQATGAVVTASSDVYSLAVVGYQLLTGRTPFVGAPAAVALEHVRTLPPPLPESIPDDLRALIGRALDKDPTKRPANGDVMASELRALRDAPAAVRPTTGHATAADRAPDLDPVAPTVLDATKVWAAQAEVVATQSARSAQLVDAPGLRRSRRRRRLLVGVVALCAVAIGVLAVRSAATSGPAGQIPAPSTGSSIAATTSVEQVATTLAPTVVEPTAVTPAPAPVTAAPAPGKGKNNGKATGRARTRGRADSASPCRVDRGGGARVVGGQGQGDGDRHATSGGGVDGDRATVGVYQCFDDGHAQPGAAGAARPRRIGAEEALEDVRRLLGRHAGAVVADRDRCRLIGVQPDRGRRARWRVHPHVGQQVVDDLADPAGVAVDGDRRAPRAGRSAIRARPLAPRRWRRRPPR